MLLLPRFMECLDYSDAAELFNDLVSDINGDSQVSHQAQAAKNEKLDKSCTENNDPDPWVEVFVPVASLQKHIESQNVKLSEDEVIREANREKVLEMYGTSKIEAIPLSHQDPKTEGGEEEEHSMLNEPITDFTSGSLFAPPAAKRSLRHPNPPFRCPECFSGFTRADNLKRHFKILHEGSEAFTCPYCFRAFARKNTLQRHIISQHTKEKKYSCEFCNKKFTYSFEVPVHIQNTHSETKGYQCTQCDIKFKWPRSLDRHILSVHEGFKFKCTECGVLLGCLDAYRKHGARFHPALSTADSQPLVKREGLTSDPSHICPHCRCAFAVKANLERHMTKMHNKKEGEKSSYQCQWCSNKFKTLDTYQRHVNKFHSSQTLDVEGAERASKVAGGTFGIQSTDMTEISLTEFLSQYNSDQSGDFP